MIGSVKLPMYAGLTQSYFVREYISSDTWTKPSNLSEIFVVCVGAGGGGGAGRRNNANSTGGAGGAGGGITFRRIPEASLTGATYSITVGVGGGGGTVAAASILGSNGLTGGDTSFDSLVIAIGGVGGNIGLGTGVATVSRIPGATPSRGPFQIRGGGTLAPISNATTSTPNGMDSTIAAPAGGNGGGHLNSAPFPSYEGSTGGGVYNLGVLTPGGAAGATLGGTGVSGSNDICTTLLFITDIPTTYGIGTGGGGGGGSRVAGVDGGAGGQGGRAAGGGGGGSVSTAATYSGAGGTGGDGLCIVVEYFTPIL